MSSHHKRDKRGLNLHYSQHVDIPDFRHETVIIPSTSAPNWGSYFILDLKEKGCIIHDLALQFTASAISGYTNSSPYPHYNPAIFWFTRLEIVINNTVIDTVYPIELFLHEQMFQQDEKRRLVNNAMGPYDSATVRYALSSTSTQYTVHLWTFLSQTHIPLIHPKDDIQLRVYMDTLANVVNAGSLTGTPSSTLSCNLIAKLSRMPASSIQMKHQELSRVPHHFKFLESKYGTFSLQAVAAGAQSTIVLTPFVGSVSYMLFTVRYSSISGTTTVPNTGDGQYTYQPITNFAILDNSSTNIVGGVSLASNYVLEYLHKDWIKSSYSAEVANNGGGVNNNAYAYLYSFGADPIESATTGVTYNAHQFRGNEQLQITFAAQAYSNVQIDVWCLCEAALEVTSTYVKKISL